MRGSWTTDMAIISSSGEQLGGSSGEEAGGTAKERIVELDLEG